MELTIITYTEEASEERDYSQLYALEIDGKEKFEVYDGEPEDNNLSRNFNGIYNIPKLMKLAYEAGKNGEEFNVIEEQVDEY